MQINGTRIYFITREYTLQIESKKTSKIAASDCNGFYDGVDFIRLSVFGGCVYCEEWAENLGVLTKIFKLLNLNRGHSFIE